MAETTQEKTSSTTVFICGAGPTGLALAIELTRLGVACRVIDRNSEPSTLSRALGVQARTMEYFQMLGIDREFAPRSLQIVGAKVFSNNRPIVDMDLSHVATDFPYITFLPQCDTEEIMCNYATSLGVVIERGVSVSSFMQSPNSVHVELKHEDGTTEQVDCSYLVGCDGAHSSIRHGLNMKFAGETLAESFCLADCTAQFPEDLVWDKIRIYLHEGQLLGFFPLPNGQTRIIIQRASPTDSADPLTLTDLQDLVDVCCGQGVILSDPTWMTRFSIHQRVVETYQVGRVFLAGDAAHIHSPVGGQGMNTGIQDAINLAWKISYVERGLALPEFLTTYHTERHAKGTELVETTGRANKLLFSQSKVLNTLRDHVAPLATSVGVIRQAASGWISQISLNYRDSPIVRELRPAGLLNTIGSMRYLFGVRAGDRAPNISFSLDDGQRTELYRLQAQACHRHVAVFFTGLQWSPLMETQFREIRALLASYPDFCDLYILFAGTALNVKENLLDCDVPLFCDSDAVYHTLYGVSVPTLYIVRPDMYVGARSVPVDLPAIKSYVQDLLGK